MKRGITSILLLVGAVVLWSGPSIQHQQAAALRHRVTGGGNSDDFNRGDSDSLGAGWVEATGDLDIASNRLQVGATTNADSVAIWQTDLGSANGYLKVTLVTGVSHFPYFVFRYTNAASPYYFVYDSGASFNWGHQTAINGTATSIDGSALAPTNATTYGLTWTGTGTGTLVRIWVNPTGNVPDSASSWGGDATPDKEFTQDPASAVDTGNFVGLGGYQTSANSIQWDDFYCGAL